jgi:NAD(P)-dependent dehydrogenase (short-subunit alcohol dehydrogenase family)
MGVSRRFATKRCIVAGRGEIAAAVVARLEEEGAAVAALEGDALSSDGGAATAVAKAVAQLGGLDVLVTAFHYRNDRPFLEIDDEAWARSLDENLKAAFMVGREGARAMVAAGGGAIVHVGSDVGARPGPGTAAYAAAKAGVHLMTTCMALDLAPDGVRVCAVAACDDGSESPGPTELGPADVAAAVAFCASDDASYVLGSTFFLNGPMPIRG